MILSHDSDCLLCVCSFCDCAHYPVIHDLNLMLQNQKCTQIHTCTSRHSISQGSDLMQLHSSTLDDIHYRGFPDIKGVDAHKAHYH